MPEESTTPDLLEQTRHLAEAGSRKDFDAEVAIFAPDGVFDVSPMGLGVFKGRAAIRDALEEVQNPYDEVLIEIEENLDLGNGVGFAVFVLTGRLAGSGSALRMRYAGVGVWANGLIQRGTNYLDVDEARAAAERLVEERE